MGNKNNNSKKNKNKEPIDKNEDKDFIHTINIDNINITGNIIEDYIKLNPDDKPKNKNESKETLSSNNKKSIKFYYNNKIIKIKLEEEFNLVSLKKILKSRFLIEESIDNIFFIDEDEDILVLNSNIPDNLTVNLFIMKDFIPKNPATALKISENINSNNKSQKSLLKFHWIIENDKMRKKCGNTCIIDKYIYAHTSIDKNPSVSSSSSFTVGKYFFVLRIGSFQAYQSLAIVDDETPDYHSRSFSTYYKKTFIGYQYMERVHGLGINDDIAIYIDMDMKKCRFYNYDKKTIILSGKINSDSVKLYAWKKSGGCGKGGMTILNEGCIPIPDWVNP